MRNEPFYQDNPDQPLQPPSPPQRGPQGQLILGGPQNPQNPSSRRPYQYPPSRLPHPGNQPRPYSQRPPYQPSSQYPGNQPGTYPQQPPFSESERASFPGSAQGASAPPGSPPEVQRYPYRQQPQPGQMAGTPPSPKKQRRGRRPGCLVGCLAVILLLCVAGWFFVMTLQHVLAFGSAISTQAPLSTQTGYMSAPNRVNLLIMGYGGGHHDGAYLTDSMEVISLVPQNHHTTVIAIPRDLWVQIPPNSGQYAKINYAYVYGSNNGANPVGGGNMAAQKVSDVTGLNVNYWVTIDFTGFRDFINAIGGVDVYVPDSFTAKYPANDDPSINASWITIHFSKGMQHMDGERAIEYARARYSLDNPAEGTDFARAVRQQIIMKAALSKLRQVSTWPSLFNALNALQHAVYSNLSLADLAAFAMKMDLTNAHHANLTNNNVLTDAVSSDGQDILLPVNNNWQIVKDYIKQQLYN